VPRIKKPSTATDFSLRLHLHSKAARVGGIEAVEKGWGLF